jgi:hypothetical protein
MKRQIAIETLNELPKEFNLEDLFERLVFIDKVEKGLDQISKGQTVSHDTVVKHFRKK